MAQHAEVPADRIQGSAHNIVLRLSFLLKTHAIAHIDELYKKIDFFGALESSKKAA